jgi:hypothetical protein
VKDAQQLIILGNGFDLASGLKSTYGQFIEYVMKESGISVDEIKQKIASFDIESLSDIKDSYIEQEDFFKLNIWIWLFINSDLSEASNWQSVEEQIYEYLDNDLIELASNPKGLHDVSITKEKYKKATLIVNCFIKCKEIEIERTPNSIAKFLMEQLNHLEASFEQFLFENAGYTVGNDGTGLFDYFEPARTLLTKIVEKDSITEESAYNVMSFNYTDPWDERWGRNGGLKDGFLVPNKSLSVHGQALARLDDEVNRIIFGIDNQDLKISEYNYKYIFTKTFRTLVNYSDTKTSQNATENNIFDKGIKVIKFFGHSLGEADYSYFQQMFDYYDLYNNDELRLYFYFKKYDDRDIIDYLNEQSAMVIRLLEKYGETMSNKDHGKNLVTRLEMTKRLYIKEIK